jgi:hypothetical protein
MSEVLSFISFVIFIVTFVYMLFSLIRLRNRNIELKLQVIDLIQKNEIFQNALDSRESKQVEKSEGFLNFITQSRDWAFQYIEDVQDGLNKFIKDIEPEIEYFKEYGDIAAMSPNYYSMKKIVESYEELKKLLPEDEEVK